MKIAVIGYSGSGKSTLAEKLSSYSPFPKLHNRPIVQFQPGWQDSEPRWMLKRDEGLSFLNMRIGLSTATIHGVATRKEWSKLIRLSF